MTYTIEPFESQPKRCNVELPLTQLAIGYGFVIAASYEQRFPTFRTMIWKYNKTFGTTIRAHKQADGTLRIWREADNAQATVSDALPTTVGIIDQARLASALDDI